MGTGKMILVVHEDIIISVNQTFLILINSK